jgi:hypothetical protein
MASDVNPGQISATAVSTTVSTAVSTAVSVSAGGKTLPGGTTPAPVGAVQAPLGAVKAPVSATPQALVDLLNKHLNDSGRPAQYRVDPGSAEQLIQEINPANGDVVGEFSVTEFPALARSIGVSGLLIDALA